MTLLDNDIICDDFAEPIELLVMGSVVWDVAAFMAVWWSSYFFSNTMTRHSVISSWRREETRSLRKVGKWLPIGVISYPRRIKSLVASYIWVNKK